MHRNEALDDRQAKSCAFVAALIGLTGLEERITDPLQVVCANADSAIDHTHHKARTLDAGSYRDGAPALGKLDRVGQQVQQHLLERARIAGDLRQVSRYAGDNIDPVLTGFQDHQIAAADERFAWRKQFRNDLEIAALHLRHIKDAVDDRQEMKPGFIDQLGVFLTPCGVDHHLVLAHDHFREPDNGIQRRAQFMAHGGKEARLGRTGPLGFHSSCI